MPFHRLVTPTYFGGLIGGHDYLNTPSDPSVGGSGDPALVDPIKSGGSNDGTYFVAFREDGRSAAVNRGLKALADNTDALDTLLRTSIPVITSASATAVGAVATFNLTGEIWVGETGTADNQTNRNKIVRVVDSNDNDIEVSGAKVVATLIHDGASVNVVGTQASGFRTNASVNVSPSIPNGTNYRAYYGIRGNYAHISETNKGALIREQIRNIQNVSGEVRSLFRQIHSEVAVNQAWDAAFDSTIRSLAARGLNEIYRKATTQPGGFTSGEFNSAGSGAVLNRDGRAVEIQADTNMLVQNVGWKDGNHALLKLGLEDARGNTQGSVSGNSGGDFGIWHESEWKARSGTGMATRGKSAGPVVVDVIPLDMRASAMSGDTLLTYIDPTVATATTNPEGSGSSFSVDCAPGQYFALTGPTRTAIRCGIDMVEITDSNGLVRTFYIAEVVSATRIRVVGPAGTTASPFQAGTDAGCRIRIIQTQLSLGGYLGIDGDWFRRVLYVAPPAIMTTAVANEIVPRGAFFASQTGSAIDATAQAQRARALEWGSTGNPDSGGTVNGTITARGWLSGDGSVHMRRWFLTGGGAFIDEFGNAEFDDVVCENINAIDITADDVTFDQAVVSAIREVQPDQYTHLRDDFLGFMQLFPPDDQEVIHTPQGFWRFDEILDIFTLNNGTSSGKNPGVLEIISAGGGVARTFAMYPLSQGLFDLAFLQSMTIVIKVNDDPANVTSSLGVGFMQNVAFQNGGTNSLFTWYSSSGGWRLVHRRANANSVNHFTELITFGNDEYITVDFNRVSTGLEIRCNGVLVTTVLNANMPTGLVTFCINCITSAADNEPFFMSIDFIDVVATTGAVRHD